jgi:hypothetical protein
LKGHVTIDGALLHSPDAELTPAGDSHGLGQHSLGGGAGLVLVEQGVEKLKEARSRFLLQDDRAGEETVAEAVAG